MAKNVDSPTELFVRHPKNPILTSDQWPYPVHTVFNPAAVRTESGETVLLCRCEDFRGISHLTVARSKDGASKWKIDPQPAIKPEPELYPEEEWGMEDARITFIPDQKLYAIAYTAFSRNGPGVALATTTDFVTFTRLGQVLQPEDKDAAMFPCRFGGEYVMIHRPVSGTRADMWISYSQDLLSWGKPKLLLEARRGAWWDANKIGLACPPIETKAGWLMLYHGVRKHASGSLYRVGVALLDLKSPEKVLLRSEPWCFAPKAPYERTGDVPNVIFPTGFTVGDDGDTLHIYYGCADTSIGLATASIKDVMEWLVRNGRSS